MELFYEKLNDSIVSTWKLNYPGRVYSIRYKYFNDTTQR